MQLPQTKFAETQHEARLAFSESADSLLVRLSDLSGTRLPVGRGLIPQSNVTLTERELRVSQFGRTLMRGRVEPQPQGCSLLLSTSAPFLKAGVYLWVLSTVPGWFLVATSIIGGYGLDESALEGFLFAGFVGTFVFPSQWGRRWEFHRIAAALSERLHANNDAELQLLSRAQNLSRRGAWTTALSAFLCGPLVAINGFLVSLTGRRPSAPPWLNWRKFLHESVVVDGVMLFLFLFLGWAFAGSGAICGHVVAKLLPSDRQRLCRWTVTSLAMCVSLWLCWLISGSTTLEKIFYMP